MDKTGKPVAAAAVLAVGIVIAGWLLYRGVVHFKDSDRVVSVKGLSEKEVKADRAIWPLVYKLAGNDLGSLYNTIESTNAKIVSFLLSNGISEDEITVSPRRGCGYGYRTLCHAGREVSFQRHLGADGLDLEGRSCGGSDVASE